MRGISSKDHILPIKELIKLPVSTSRPLQLIDVLRKTRHNINDYGYIPSVEEVEDTISLAKSCFKPLYDNIQDKIKDGDEPQKKEPMFKRIDSEITKKNIKFTCEEAIKNDLYD